MKNIATLLADMKAYRKALQKAKNNIKGDFVLNLDGMIEELDDDIFEIENLMGDD